MDYKYASFVQFYLCKIRANDIFRAITIKKMLYIWDLLGGLKTSGYNQAEYQKGIFLFTEG